MIGSCRFAGRRADPLKPSPFPQWRVEPGVTPLLVVVEDITSEKKKKKNPAKMVEKFVGTWKMISSENFDDYMKAIGRRGCSLS